MTARRSAQPYQRTPNTGYPALGSALKGSPGFSPAQELFGYKQPVFSGIVKRVFGYNAESVLEGNAKHPRTFGNDAQVPNTFGAPPTLWDHPPEPTRALPPNTSIRTWPLRHTTLPNNQTLSGTPPTKRPPAIVHRRPMPDPPQPYQKPPSPTGLYYNPHLVRIRQYKSRSEIQAYFRDLPAQQHDELLRTLDTSLSKQSWLEMTPADQQKVYRRFQKFYPESPFAEQKPMDFVNDGRALQNRARFDAVASASLGEDSVLTVLTSLVTVVGFVVDCVTKWKEGKKEGEKNRLEEEIEALRKRLQDVEREGKGEVVGVALEDVTAWLEDATEG